MMTQFLPGDAVWIRQGVFLIKSIEDSNVPIGSVIKIPKHGIFIDRVVINDKCYIKAYIHTIGERLIEENEILDLK